MSSYAAAHADPKGPGDARPTASKIVADNAMEGKLTGKVAVVTGSSSGIGIETVRALIPTGLKFILPARNLEKVKKALGSDFNPDTMEVVPMDQTSLMSVRDAAATILSKAAKISLLINNAGIMAVPDRQLSKDGFELQFATNHLSHFLLFQLLKPALLAGSTSEFQSRVVSLASDGHRWHGLFGPDYNFEKGDYNPQLAYAQSKTANIYFANELDRRYGTRGLHGLSVHPGVIATGLGRYLTEEQIQGLLESEGLKKYWKSPEQGAATTVWAAIGKEWEGKGGRYLSHCGVPELGDLATDPAGYTHVEHTYNPEGEAMLWKDSLKMVGLEDDK